MVGEIDLAEALAEAAHAPPSSPGERAALASWSRENALLGPRSGVRRGLAWVLPAPTLALAIVAIAGGPSWPVGVALLPLLGYWAWTRAAAARVIASVGIPSQALASYERMAARIERESFASPQVDLCRVARHRCAGPRDLPAAPHRLGGRIAQPARGGERRSSCGGARGLALERWRARCGVTLRWLGDRRRRGGGSFSALASERPDHEFPRSGRWPSGLHCRAAGALPLDPAASVANDVDLGDGNAAGGLGSNMSGEHLRAVGADAVLALSGARVPESCASRR
jgi:hypothetical protein